MWPQNAKNPHPNPLPEYRARGKRATCDDPDCPAEPRIPLLKDRLRIFVKRRPGKILLGGQRIGRGLRLRESRPINDFDMPVREGDVSNRRIPMIPMMAVSNVAVGLPK